MPTKKSRAKPVALVSYHWKMRGGEVRIETTEEDVVDIASEAAFKMASSENARRPEDGRFASMRIVKREPGGSFAGVVSISPGDIQMAGGALRSFMSSLIPSIRDAAKDKLRELGYTVRRPA